MLAALVAGTHDPLVLAELARGRLRAKLPALREALEGRFGAHHGLLVGEMLARIDQMDETIARLSAEVARVAAPFSPLLALLMTIPGMSRRTAEVIVAEIGPDMGRFPTAAHLASWSGQQRVGRQAWLGSDPQGIQVAAGRAGRGGPCGRADQEQLPGRPVCPAAGSSGSQEGRPGRCPLDPGDRLASAQPR
jgi:transposase